MLAWFGFLPIIPLVSVEEMLKSLPFSCLPFVSTHQLSFRARLSTLQQPQQWITPYRSEKKILADLKMEQTKPTQIFCDNQVAIAISKNPVLHGITKHFKITLHFIGEAQDHQEVVLVYCSSKNQIADVLTKGLHGPRFEELRKALGTQNFGSKEEK